MSKSGSVIGVSKEQVIWCYRAILGREPESERVIAEHMKKPDFFSLRKELLNSKEFFSSVGLNAFEPNLLVPNSGSGFPLLFAVGESLERQFAFPFEPENREICKKRREFLKEYTSHDYHLSVLAYINENLGLKDKRILELGGSNIPREIPLDDFSVKQYVSVDYINSWHPDPNHQREVIHDLGDLQKVFTEDEPYLIFSGSVNDLSDDFLAGYFDIIISFSTIEHFENMPLMLEKASNVLKKDGFYFATSEPLWSSGKGHHFWISSDYNFQVTNDFDFAHLLYNKNEFLEFFRSKRDIEKISDQIYDWKGINRLFYKEIEEAVRSSDFSSKVIFPWMRQNPPSDILNMLQSRYTDEIKDQGDFSIRGVQWVLKK